MTHHQNMKVKTLFYFLIPFPVDLHSCKFDTICIYHTTINVQSLVVIGWTKMILQQFKDLQEIPKSTSIKLEI